MKRIVTGLTYEQKCVLAGYLALVITLLPLSLLLYIIVPDPPFWAIPLFWICLATLAACFLTVYKWLRSLLAPMGPP